MLLESRDFYGSAMFRPTRVLTGTVRKKECQNRAKKRDIDLAACPGPHRYSARMTHGMDNIFKEPWRGLASAQKKPGYELSPGIFGKRPIMGSSAFTITLLRYRSTVVIRITVQYSCAYVSAV